jgi:hypothetical protein
VSVTGTAAQARSGVLNRDVYGALVVSPATVAPRDTLYVASGGGAALSNVLKGVIGAAGARQHRSLTVVDLAPAPQAKDFDGLSSFYLVVGWSVGGYLCASLLSISAGAKPSSRRRAGIRTGALALYAIAGGILGAVIVGPVLGALPGSVWALAGLGALVVFSVGMLTLALQALTGIIGIGLAVLVVVIAGNPSAGGAFPWPMLPPFWRAIGPWLPPGAGTWTARSIAYFHGNAVVTSLLLLSAYAVAGTAVTLLLTLRPPGRHVAPAGTVTSVPRHGHADGGTAADSVPRARHAASGEVKAARDEARTASGGTGAGHGEPLAGHGETGAASGQAAMAPGESETDDKTGTAHGAGVKQGAGAEHGETEMASGASATAHGESEGDRDESRALSGPEGPRADQG